MCVNLTLKCRVPDEYVPDAIVLCEPELPNPLPPFDVPPNPGSPDVEYAISRVPTAFDVDNVITVLPLPFVKSMDAALETSEPPSS